MDLSADLTEVNERTPKLTQGLTKLMTASKVGLVSKPM
jgi:hypothetical protein